MTFPNRIAVAPMCQYMASDGSPTDWHLQHWMNLAMSGAGMVTVEATAVERRGRITHGDLGLYSDENEATVGRMLAAARRVSPAGTQFGVQLAHAGRKASTQLPWRGGGALEAGQDPWTTVGPSAVPFTEGWHVPEALDEAGIEAIIGKFVAASERAVRAGFDFIELHGAHGYLLHEFLSPFSNRRDDRWGGSPENRMRLIVEIAKAMRAALPGHIMIGARLSISEWMDGGFGPDAAVDVAQALKEAGAAYICCSSGGNAAQAKIVLGPGYQVPFSEKIRKEAGIATRAVGLIVDPQQANAIISEGRADFVALARAMLADPRWPWRAAVSLGVPLEPIDPYSRAASTIKEWIHPREPRKSAA